MATLYPAVRRRNRNQTPNWIVTFADLATLLLTFFILLLSFAELDVEKYRAMAQSMAVALGNPDVVSGEVGGPSPARPESELTDTLRAAHQTVPRAEPEFIDDRGPAPDITRVPEDIVTLTSRLIGELEEEVADESLSVSYNQSQVVIRFSERATFNSGEAEIKQNMLPIIDRVVDVVAQCMGDVVVSGHTDDVPITSSRFRSNWDLSAARAVSVVHELVLDRRIPAERVVAAGRAEALPLVPNTSAANRARNRRVEIAIREPLCGKVPPRDQPVDILP